MACKWAGKFENNVYEVHLPKMKNIKIISSCVCMNNRTV